MLIRMIVDMSRQTIRMLLIVTAPKMMQNVSRKTMRMRMLEIVTAPWMMVVIKTTTRRKV